MTEQGIVLEHRKTVLSDLLLHLSKVKEEELMENTVETIIEGFFLQKQAEALLETKPFELSGD